MKEIIIILFSVFLLSSCTTTKPLYSWGKYEIASYKYLKSNDDKSTKELLESYKKIIEKQKGTRGIVPPGVYADYGFVLLQTDKTDEGKVMLAKEIELYPESKVFVERILKMLKNEKNILVYWYYYFNVVL